ncbi:MAG TPA: hypothetical protein VLV54_18550 [Thermoanaerobaculia bacterium]|nr:hypothetical protein [Thermoanaerobaculia bacterium]
MTTRSFRRTTILFLLIALFATPWVSAAESRATERAQPGQALEPARFELLNQLWNTLRSLWSEEGCHIDPDGRCLTNPSPKPPPTLQTDTGCHIDPSGICHS